MGSLQSIMQQPGGQQGQGPAPPTHEQIAAMLDHLGAFQQEWMRLLKIPDIGKKDVKGDIMETMADMMGDQYVTLAQVMNQLKDLPTTPLGQKQWIQENMQKAEQATVMLLQQARRYRRRHRQELKPSRERNHQDMISGAMKYYDHHGKKGQR